jgi:hypothetical protein
MRAGFFMHNNILLNVRYLDAPVFEKGEMTERDIAVKGLTGDNPTN